MMVGVFNKISVRGNPRAGLFASTDSGLTLFACVRPVFVTARREGNKCQNPLDLLSKVLSAQAGPQLLSNGWGKKLALPRFN